MRSKAGGDPLYGSLKDKRKLVRSANELLSLLILACLVYLSLVTVDRYEPETAQAPAQTDKGFIALSYFGVDALGSEALISAERLSTHLAALKNAGYVTVSQQDVIDYYESGKALPEKALLLLFEDGRRDTAILAQKALEKQNMLATMLTYAEKFEGRDSKFLQASEVKELLRSSFWESGTNGYRLSYINVFDRYGDFFGEMSTQTFNAISPYVERNYNHYLMDYIRDAEGIPVETYETMVGRVAGDYALLAAAYEKGLGGTPRLYAHMHGNTGMYATNALTSEINEREIAHIFSLAFNREGGARNDAETSPLDLTRMQPQAYWYANHLIMRLRADTGETLAFTAGDSARAGDFTALAGALECAQDRAVLTTEPGGTALARLDGIELPARFTLTVTLAGNVLGTQTLYLGADDALRAYVAVRVTDNVLTVAETRGEEEKTLLRFALSELDGKDAQTAAEDRKAALDTAVLALEKYEKRNARQEKLLARLSQAAAGADETEGMYEKPLSLSDAGSRALELRVENGALSVGVDGRRVASDLALTNAVSGKLYLGAESPAYGYSRRNVSDDVYDGVFVDLAIRAAAERTLYYYSPTGWEAFRVRLARAANVALQWITKTL